MTPMRAPSWSGRYARHQEQGFYRCLPLLEILLGLGKLLDKFGGALEGDELATTGQGNGVVEGARPISHDAIIRGIRCSLKIGQVNLLGRGE
jgi:hypothetical protein